MSVLGGKRTLYALPTVEGRRSADLLRDRFRCAGTGARQRLQSGRSQAIHPARHEIIVGSADARWRHDGLAGVFSDGRGGMLVNIYTGADLLLLGSPSYDWITRRRLHTGV
jgi:hypothetical protein